MVVFKNTHFQNGHGQNVQEKYPNIKIIKYINGYNQNIQVQVQVHINLKWQKEKSKNLNKMSGYQYQFSRYTITYFLNGIVFLLLIS